MLLRVRHPFPVALPIVWPLLIVRLAGCLAKFAQTRRQFYAVKPWWAFVGCLVLEHGVMTRAACAFIYHVLELSPPWWSGFRISTGNYILFWCGRAATEETILFQVLPIEFFRWLGLPVGAQLALSWFTFSAMHYAGGGWGHGLGPGLVGGFYLASAYLHFRPCSLWGAVTATVGIHALHNFLCLVIW